MSDVIHRKGFPHGWYVQERSPQEALLCAKHWQGFSTCICCKPKLQDIETWLHQARVIAKAMVANDAVQLAMDRAEENCDGNNQEGQSNG
jgi:hypothetical protein